MEFLQNRENDVLEFHLISLTAKTEHLNILKN